MNMYILMYMKKTNALKLRQSLGMILKDLQKTGQPLLVEKDRKPAAVLITVEDYFKRFVDREADERPVSGAHQLFLMNKIRFLIT